MKQDEKETAPMEVSEKDDIQLQRAVDILQDLERLQGKYPRLRKKPWSVHSGQCQEQQNISSAGHWSQPTDTVP